MFGWIALLVGGLSLAGPTPAASGDHLLDVPYRNQLDGSAYAMANCGPTSLSMALAYYGVDASPGDLRIRAMKAQQSWVDDDGGYSDSYGVFVYNLAAAAESFGMHADGLWRREGNRADRLHEWQAIDLRREIQADRPVIVQVQYRALPNHNASSAIEDHYIVVRGFLGADFVYNDPLGVGDSGSGQTISEQDLMTAMSGASTPRVGFAVVGGK